MESRRRYPESCPPVMLVTDAGERKFEYSELRFRTILIFFCVNIVAITVIEVNAGFASELTQEIANDRTNHRSDECWNMQNASA